MSRSVRRHYEVAGEHRAIVLEQVGAALRARIDGSADALVVDAKLLRALPSGAELHVVPGGRAVVVRDGPRVHVALGGRTYVLDVVAARAPGAAPAVSDEPHATSPMTGVVAKVLVAPGAAVAAGGTLCVVEAMKMEFAVDAPRDVVVDAVRCAVGDRVDIGQVLVTYAAAAPEGAA